MGFNRLSDLPADVRRRMPHPAQKMWMDVYNEAADHGAGDPESEAYRAVEHRYERVGDHWVGRPPPSDHPA